jgi:acyl carrier protein
MIQENVNTDPLTDYIRTHAPHLAAEVTEETPLLEHGLLDSLNLMTLVAFLERRYQLAVPENQITPTNFRNLAAIRQLIDRLKHQAGQA